ncbi:MAG: hypothetical protein QM526_01890 [Alphaproteobacteria bacterium]|nr:hypothetical protein [Alphaproteobacteria bacterium]
MKLTKEMIANNTMLFSPSVIAKKVSRVQEFLMDTVLSISLNVVVLFLTGAIIVSYASSYGAVYYSNKANQVDKKFISTERTVFTSIQSENNSTVKLIVSGQSEEVSIRTSTR